MIFRRWSALVLIAGVISLAVSFAGVVRAETRGSAPRIITLAPHLAEMVYAAGAGDTLVGTVEYSDFPDAVLQLPRVGDAFRLDRERILSLQPDLLLAWQGGTPAAVIDQLRGDGYEVVLIGGSSLASVADALEQIGRLTGRVDTAERSASAYRQELAALRDRYAARAVRRTFFQISERPLYTVTAAQIISQAIALCGGENVFADLPGLAAQVSAEAVVAANPQVMMATAGGAGDPLARWQRFEDLAAVRDGHMYLVNGDLVSRPGPRLLSGVAQICEYLEMSRSGGSD
jgi:iron complex transport system substrate-binding protein